MTSSNGPTARLPVFHTVKETYCVIWCRRGALGRALLLPFILVIVLSVGDYLLVLHLDRLWLSLPPDDTEFDTTFWLIATYVPRQVYALFYLIPLAWFGTTWHRELILGPEQPRDPIWPWTRCHTRYTLCLLAVFFVSFLPLIILTGSFGIGAAFTMFFLRMLWSLELPWFYLIAAGVQVICVYLFARFGLLLPSVALSRPGSFQAAWRRSRHNGLQLAGSLIVAVLLLVIAFAAIRWGLLESCSVVTRGLQGHSANLAVFSLCQLFVAISLLNAISRLAVFVVVVTLLSLAYRAIVEPPDRMDEEPHTAS